MDTQATIIQHLQSRLSPHYSDIEIKGIGRIMSQECLDIPFVLFYSDKYSDLTQLQKDIVQQTVDRVLNNEPIQYIIGHANFYDLTLEVNSATLIPRPETEELVELIIRNNNNGTPLSIVDIGTGSGCIAIALSIGLPKASVEGWDISDLALQTAQRNANNHHTTTNFSKIDILHSEPEGMFDIIVSNPPYIVPSQKSDMRPNVLDYEPHQALFVPEDNPLLFYIAVADYAKSHLNNGGKLYLEINAIFGALTCDMLTNKGFNRIHLYKDIAGRDRMIEAYL